MKQDIQPNSYYPQQGKYILWRKKTIPSPKGFSKTNSQNPCQTTHTMHMTIEPLTNHFLWNSPRLYHAMHILQSISDYFEKIIKDLNPQLYSLTHLQK